MNTLQIPGVRNDNVTIQEILCDDNGSFIRRYIYSNNVLIAAVDVGFDGTTYIVSGNVVNCQENNRNFEILCDFNTSFIRQYIYDGDTLVAFNDYDFDGNPYVPVGTTTPCVDVRIEAENLCDDFGSFIRKYKFVGNTLFSAIDYDVSGVPYNPIGLISNCELRKTFFEVLCDNTSSFIRKYNYVNEILVSQFDYALDGTPYVPIGNIYPCLSNTTHREIFCDDIGQFGRTYIYNLSHNPIGYLDYDLNTLLSYTPTGTVRKCSDESNYVVPMCGYDNGSQQFVSFFRQYLLTNDTMTTIYEYDISGNTFSSVGLINITIGNCGQVDEEFTLVCTDQGNALRRTLTSGQSIVVEFIGQNGLVFVPTDWSAGSCNENNADLDVTMCGFDSSFGLFVSFVRRYEFDISGAVINIIDYDTSGNPFNSAGLNPIHYGNCEQISIIREPFCYTDPLTLGKQTVVRIRLFNGANFVIEYWEDQEGNQIVAPFNYDDYQFGECPILDIECELNIFPQLFCDPGNGDQEYYVFTFMYPNFSYPTFQVILDVGFSPYVPVTPNTLCAGSDGSLPGTILDQLAASQDLVQTYAEPEFLANCPFFKVTFGQFSYNYPTNQIVEFFPNVNVAVTETIVCGDGDPLIKRTLTSGNGNQFTQFLDVDGNTIIPTTWTPGACADVQYAIQSGGANVPDNSNVTISSLGTLLSFSIRITSGANTKLTIGANPAITLPNGAQMSWGVDGSNEYLDDDFTIDTNGGGTNTAIYTFTRKL